MKRPITLLILALCSINTNTITLKEYINKEHKNSIKNGWFEFSNDEQSIMYGNPKSFGEDSFGRPMMWYKVILKSKSADFRTAKYVYVADCDNKMLGFKHLTSYDINNKIKDNIEFPDYLVKMRTLDPDSLNYAIMDSLCTIQRETR